MKKKYWRFIPFVIFIFLSVFFWQGLSLDPQHLPSARLDKPLPAFRLPSLENEQEVLTPAALSGHLSLLNIWASWCDACTQEQVFLMQLAREGVAIYGLNYKDNIHDAKQWLEEWGNPYTMIGEDLEGKVAIDLGVYGAPETFLVDKKGIIRYRHVGIMDAEAWQKEFLPRMGMLK